MADNDALTKKRKVVSFHGNFEINKYKKTDPVIDDRRLWEGRNPHISPEAVFDTGVSGDLREKVANTSNYIVKHIPTSIKDAWNNTFSSHPDTSNMRPPKTGIAARRSYNASKRRSAKGYNEKMRERRKERREYHQSLKPPSHLLENLIELPVQINYSELQPDLTPANIKFESQFRLNSIKDEPNKYGIWKCQYDDKLNNSEQLSLDELNEVDLYNKKFGEHIYIQQQHRIFGGKLRRSKQKLSKRSTKSRKNKKTK